MHQNPEKIRVRESVTHEEGISTLATPKIGILLNMCCLNFQKYKFNIIFNRDPIEK